MPKDIQLTDYEKLRTEGPLFPRLARTVAELMSLRESAHHPDDLYYIYQGGDDVSEILDSCRIVVQDASHLEALNEVAGAHIKAPNLLRIGLRLIPEGYEADGLEGIHVSELPEVADLARPMQYISLRGCFVNGDLTGRHGKELGQYFRASYVTAKEMHVVLPCPIPFLCVESALAAVDLNEKEHSDTLEDALLSAKIVAEQNNTAFYARLLIT